MENILFQRKTGKPNYKPKKSNIICKSENIYGDGIIAYTGICKTII